VECEGVAALGQFNQDGIAFAFRRVVLGELQSKPAGLHSDSGVDMRIKVGRATKDLRSNLILLDRQSRILETVFGEVTK
jgi:hypothetical protein